jgi:phosphonopyruvate decarboxylase
MSLRGWPDPGADEPQHEVMGRTTHDLLTTMGVRHWTLRRDDTDAETVIDDALAHTAQGACAFVLLERGAISGSPEPCPQPADMSRTQALRLVVDELPDALLVATTGHTSRELFALADSPRAFYMQGSMGHASAFALGVAMSGGEDRPVVVLDGDGAALMHLGSLSTIGAACPYRLVHVILDNGSYASTGGQATTSGTTDFAAVGSAVGYRSATVCRTPRELGERLRETARLPGPHLIAVPVSSGGAAPPRATSVISAPGIADRFRRAAS